MEKNVSKYIAEQFNYCLSEIRMAKNMNALMLERMYGKAMEAIYLASSLDCITEDEAARRRQLLRDTYAMKKAEIA